MHRTWKSRVGVLALTATMGIGLVGLASPAGAAPGGNSANAKACQNGGWKTLQTSTGGSFKNEGGCVSYAAHGGVLTPAFQPTCLDSSIDVLDIKLVAPVDTNSNL